MARKKNGKKIENEIDNTSRLLCDEAANHMKVRNYPKALKAYMQVSSTFWWCIIDKASKICGLLLWYEIIHIINFNLWWLIQISFYNFVLIRNFKYTFCYNQRKKLFTFFIILRMFWEDEETKWHILVEVNMRCTWNLSILRFVSSLTLIKKRFNFKYSAITLEKNVNSYFAHQLFLDILESYISWDFA